jgi:hypothetical protein
MEELSAEIVATDGNCIFRIFHPLFTYKIIQNNLRPVNNKRKVLICA